MLQLQCRSPQLSARPDIWYLYLNSFTVAVNPNQSKICLKFKPNSWSELKLSATLQCHRMHLICQSLPTSYHTWLQYLSWQTHCQADFTSVSCGCGACWAPTGDCLTLPAAFPPHHPPRRLQRFHTSPFLTTAACAGNNLSKHTE